MDDDAVYSCADYRAVIRAWLAIRARSQARLARRAGVSRSMVSMVLAGVRDIPLAQARAWAAALDLSDDQQTYFEALVRAEVGETLALRRAARVYASATRQYHDARRLTPDERPLFGHWFVPVLLELARVGALPADVAEIGRLLWPAVDEVVIEQVLGELQARGVLVPDGEGRWSTDGRPLATEREIAEDRGGAIRAYHASQLEHANLSLEHWDRDQRHVASVVVAVPADAVPKLIEAVHRFHLEVIEPFRADGSAAVRVVQVSVQLFPRTNDGRRGV